MTEQEKRELLASISKRLATAEQHNHTQLIVSFDELLKLSLMAEASVSWTLDEHINTIAKEQGR